MTIGVWVGRPDGAPVPGLVGRAAAAPILFDAFARTGQAPAPLPHAPKGAIFAATNKLPPPLQRFRSGGASERRSRAAAHHVPAQRRAHRTRPSGGKPEPVALKIAGGVEPLTVLVNGVPLAAQGGRRTLFFEPDGPGFVRLTVMDARGAADSVMVRLQ